jgi:small-conductance mechanosensitive channel
MLLPGLTVALELARIDLRGAAIVVLIELSIGLALSVLLYVSTLPVRRRLARNTAALASSIRDRAAAAARQLALATFTGIAVAVLAYNGWLIARGMDVRSFTLARIESFTMGAWHALLLSLGQIGLASLGLLIGTRLVRRLIGALQSVASRHDDQKDRQLEKLFTGLDRAIVNTARLLLLALACWLLRVPSGVVDILLLIVRIYVIVSGGLLLIRGTATIVSLLDGRGRRYADCRGWIDQYDHLRSLLPTLSACLEYALWIAMAALVIVQLGPMQGLALWGPRLVGAIAVFFVGRVLIEVGHLEIDRRMLPPEGLDEVSLRRRATMTPLVQSVFTYAGNFATAVLMLAALGFNAMPFLAGAGILGLVVGFGAQPLINDVVSGFFILLENVYLVGDLIEVDKARGIVEAIEFRVTKIRDDEGRLHVIRNGDMKPVVNYSKEFAMAVVPVDVAYDVDLRSVFSTLREAGRVVRADNRNVLSDTRIDGIMAFGPSEMTVKTTTKVRPGTHESVAAALRLAIKEAFDRHAAEGARRTSLIPDAVHASSRR